jgi:hypothetical protein
MPGLLYCNIGWPKGPFNPEDFNTFTEILKSQTNRQIIDLMIASIKSYGADNDDMENANNFISMLTLLKNPIWNNPEPYISPLNFTVHNVGVTR